MPKKGEHLGQETKEKISRARKGKSHSKETRKRIGDTRRELFAEGKLVVWNKDKQGIYTAKTKQLISEGAKRSWQNFADKDRVNKGRSERLSLRWTDKNFYNMMYPILIKNNQEGRNNPAITAKRRTAMIKLWRNVEYVSKVKEGLKLRPSDPEIYLDAILQLNFEKEWVYTGDFQFWIEGKNPDFINRKRKELLIEYNGHTLTHTPKRDRAKTEHYAKFGYKTLNLYPQDLKNEAALVKKIKDFYGS